MDITIISGLHSGLGFRAQGRRRREGKRERERDREIDS